MKTVGFKSGNTIEITEEQYNDLIWHITNDNLKKIIYCIVGKTLVKIEEIEYMT